jgi:hypothetical protein
MGRWIGLLLCLLAVPAGATDNPLAIHVQGPLDEGQLASRERPVLMAVKDALGLVRIVQLDASGNLPVSLTGPVTVIGTVTVNQGTSPWVMSGTVTTTQGTSPWVVGGTVAVTQSTSPWVVSGSVSVSNFPATQPVSGTVAVSNFPATQPVSGTVAVTQGTSPWVGSVAGTNAAGSGVPNPVVVGMNGNGGVVRFITSAVTFPNAGDQLVATGPGVWDGATNWNKTLGDASGRTIVVGPVASGVATVGNPLLVGAQNGAAAAAYLRSDTPNTDNRGDTFQHLNTLDYLYAYNGSTWDRVQLKSGALLSAPVSADLAVTATGAAAAAVTATLPAVASKFHYISYLEITRYASVATSGVAAPLVVTTTNLPGSLAFTIDTVQAVGATKTFIYNPNLPLKSSTVNTATTIVCPATAQVIWRVNVIYRADP